MLLSKATGRWGWKQLKPTVLDIRAVPLNLRAVTTGQSGFRKPNIRLLLLRVETAGCHLNSLGYRIKHIVVLIMHTKMTMRPNHLCSKLNFSGSQIIIHYTLCWMETTNVFINLHTGTQIAGLNCVTSDSCIVNWKLWLFKAWLSFITYNMTYNINKFIEIVASCRWMCSLLDGPNVRGDWFTKLVQSSNS